ncbi:antibiotic biosynthesis monooxygenase [Bradyrhizobium barranii subsp. apii]|uniref:Antibiotic biosynthesis monooxygenase n=1 Tax=Bradyrhizobium barranii subsp. apii TaxID=2819348 RepID=A0A8T5V6I9_9BRAD|nr:antibiotic biosynthesis monooxygenase [Bradyrhizobium barranii]UPT85859.1 antibiotic biosynthesis monooxygenase [Bradyrhizobium barranii subsp. apii]
MPRRNPSATPSTAAACSSSRNGRPSPARPTRSLDRFLPEAQREDGVKLFLISRAKDNPAQFLFYELFRDEAAFKAHQESAHFKTWIAGEALPLLAKRERAQYALM